MKKWIYLFSVVIHLLLVGEEEHARGLVEGQLLVRLLDAGRNLIPHRVQQDVDEEIVALGRHIATGQEHLKEERDTR